jgi:rubrerythrin
MTMLESFGAILTFSAELEAEDRAFYESAAENPACSGEKALFESFSRESAKNEKTALRVRRENVTEMILEPIKDFTSEAFESDRSRAGEGDRPDVIAQARDLETKALSFYQEASDRIKALPEVSRALKSLAKKRKARIGKLDDLSF